MYYLLVDNVYPNESKRVTIVNTRKGRTPFTSTISEAIECCSNSDYIISNPIKIKEFIASLKEEAAADNYTSDPKITIRFSSIKNLE